MDSIISTFHIDWKIIIAQMINFGVVFVVLYIYALKPLSKLMSERGEKIETGIKDAKKSGELLQKASEEYKENTIKLRAMAIDAQKELAKDLEQLRAKNLEKIKIDKKALVESAKNEIVTLAMLAAEKIMENKKR